MRGIILLHAPLQGAGSRQAGTWDVRPPTHWLAVIKPVIRRLRVVDDVCSLATPHCAVIPLQVIQGPAKQPISAVLVLSQPQHLTPGGSTGEGAGSSGRQGPKRPQPLAPLVKFTGQHVLAACTVSAWMLVWVLGRGINYRQVGFDVLTSTKLACSHPCMQCLGGLHTASTVLCMPRDLVGFVEALAHMMVRADTQAWRAR